MEYESLDTQGEIALLTSEIASLETQHYRLGVIASVLPEEEAGITATETTRIESMIGAFKSARDSLEA